MYSPGDPQQLSQLAKKYVDGKASSEEIKFLEEYYAAFEGQSTPFGLAGDAQLEAVDRDMSSYLQARIGQPEAARTKIVRLTPRKRLAWLSAAALIGLLAAGTYLWTAGRKAPGNATRLSETNIAPGGNKAILTLGNGTKLVLDTMANGLVTSQGGIQVLKLASGQLAYRGTSDGHTQMQYNKIETPAGGEYQVTLPDGTRVWLNAASSLKYPNVFAGKDRTVVVTGEAYFAVAKDKEKPFIVSSNGMNIQVLGTEFNLMAYPDEEAIRTTLVDGALRVITGGMAPIRNSKASVNSDKEQLLRPGEQASLLAGSDRFVVSQPDLTEVLGWKQGEFRFYNAKITTIMRQVARWYDVEVIYEGAIPQDEFYGVIPKKAYASQILNVLQKTEYVHFRIEGKKIIVIPGPAK